MSAVVARVMGWAERPPPLVFAAYAGAGLLLSGFLHYWIWRHVPTLQAWGNDGLLSAKGLSPTAFLVAQSTLALVGGLTVFAVTLERLEIRLRLVGAFSTVFAFPFLSQLLTPSATRLVYEAAFLFIGFLGYFLTRLLVVADTTGGRVAGPNPWRVMASIGKLSVALLAFLAGTVATAVVTTYPTSDVTSAEVARQLFLIAYAVAGLALLAFLPLLLKAVSVPIPDEVVG